MPPYASNAKFPVADGVSTSGLNIPSSPRLTQPDVEYVAERIRLHVENLETGDVFGGARWSTPAEQAKAVKAPQETAA